MKREFNNRLLMATAMSAMVMSGCVSKSIIVTDSSTNDVKEKRIKKTTPFSPPWRKINAVDSQRTIPEASKVIKSFSNPKIGDIAFGKATLYYKEGSGVRTASGDLFNIEQKTAAHPSLPFNTMIKVTNLLNNKSDIVRVNDRFSSSNHKIINLSPAVANGLSISSKSPTDVKVEIVGFDGIVVQKKREKVNPFKRVMLEKSKRREEPCLTCVVPVPKRERGIESVEKKRTFVVEESQKVYSYEDGYNTLPERYVHVSTYQPPMEEFIYESSMESSPTIGEYSEKRAIQIGAFREYAGAKVYAKKYDLLSDQYRVEIKEHIKDGLPLYRVHIAGFGSDGEARDFIKTYGLTGAFLVRK